VLASGQATGFIFAEYTPAGWLSGLGRALNVFVNDPAAWRKIQNAGMREDWSWANSAKQYVGVYEKAAAKKGAGSSSHS